MTTQQQTAAALTVEDVYKSYQTGNEALSILTGVSFTIQRGEAVAIVGQSGSGKTTLLSLLAGIDRPDKGAIRYGSEDITQFSEMDLAAFRGRSIGIVFQNFHLIPSLSAIDNVALPLALQSGRFSHDVAREALKQVGMSHREYHYPRQLSGGECQRVAIARAIITKPAVLLADEPSGNLDERNGDIVMALFFDLIKSQDTALVFVTHNHSLAARCDRTLKIAGGKVEQSSGGEG